jgi:hypothetical protein
VRAIVIHLISCCRSATARRAGLVAALLQVLLALSPRAFAELPLARLTAIFPAGGQAGSAVELAVTGQDLDDLTRLHFAHPGLLAKPRLSPAGVPEPGKFLLTINASVPPGLYDLRAVGRFGVTNPRTFAVSARPEISGKPGNTAPASAAELAPGSAIHAIAEPNARHFYRIRLKHNDRLFIDAWATTIDSKMEPVLLLSDPAGRELAHSLRAASLTAIAPADGDYLLAVHDVLYRGGSEYFYRVSARLLDGDSTNVRALPGPLRWPFPPASAFLDPDTLSISATTDDTNAAAIRTLHAPCDVAAAFRATRPRDVYQFDAPAGSVFWIEVVSHRLGQTAAAPFLLVQRVTKDEKGQEKVADVQEVYEPPAGGPPEFSTATRDPVYRLESKEAGTYRLLVRNLFHGLEADAPVPYRLTIRRASPDFALVAVPASPLPDPKDSRDVPIWTSLLRRGGTTLITVLASRRDGFAGEIRLEVEGLPPGLRAGPATIPQGAITGTVLLTARDDAAAWVGPIQIRGVATIDEKTVMHDARPATVALSTYDTQAKTTVVRSRLSEEFAIAVTDAEPSPLAITAPITTTQPSLDVAVGAKLSISLQLKRATDLTAPTTLKLTGHPLLAAFKEVSADPKADTVKLELDLAQIKLPPGEYTLHAEAQAKLKYANNPEAAKAAQAAAQEAEKRSTDAAAAVKTAEGTLAEAAKGTDAAAKSAAERAVTDAKAKLAAADAQKASAQARAKDLAAKAQPRDVTASFYSPSFVVKVTPPPPAPGPSK